MPSLTLSPLPLQQQLTQPTKQHPLHNSLQLNTRKPPPPPLQTTFTPLERTFDTARSLPSGSSSPVAPEYSPITPKVQPVLPAEVPQAFVPPGNGGAFTFSVPDHDRNSGSAPVDDTPPTSNEQPYAFSTSSAAPSALYMPQPPSLPFSGDDATDAIALRAAISTLQFQKQTAQRDLKVLTDLKKLALSDPLRFKTELAAGRIKQGSPKHWDVESLLDDDDHDDEHDSDEINERNDLEDATRDGSSILVDGTSAPESLSPHQRPPLAHPPIKSNSGTTFPRIPEAQNVVRMPHINWDKYNIVGAPLDELHEQQRSWPGSTPYAPDKGQPFSVAAPYNPFHDTLDPQ